MGKSVRLLLLLFSINFVYATSNKNNFSSSENGLLTSYSISVSASSSSNYTLSGNDINGSVSGNDPGLTFKIVKK